MHPKILNLDYFVVFSENMDEAEVIQLPVIKVTDGETATIETVTLPRHHLTGSAVEILDLLVMIYTASLACAEILEPNEQPTEENITKVVERTKVLKATLKERL